MCEVRQLADKIPPDLFCVVVIRYGKVDVVMLRVSFWLKVMILGYNMAANMLYYFWKYQETLNK